MPDNLHNELLKYKTKEDKIAFLLSHKVSKNLNDKDEKISIPLKIANKFTKLSKSWMFLIIFLGFTLAWIIFNGIAPSKFAFDIFPYSLNNWLCGVFAVCQATLIGLSQSQSEKKDKERDDLEFQLDYKSEMLSEESYKMIKEIYDELKNKKGNKNE